LSGITVWNTTEQPIRVGASAIVERVLKVDSPWVPTWDDAVEMTIRQALQQRVMIEAFRWPGDPDWTLAFNRACSVEGRAVYLSTDQEYVIGRVRPARGVHIVGDASRVYTQASPQGLPRLVWNQSAEDDVMFDLRAETDENGDEIPDTSINNFSVTGVVVDGKNARCFITGGASRTNIFQCTIVNFQFGIGGYDYCHSVTSLNTVIASCDVGIGNVIDCFFVQTQLANCGRAISCGAGSNTNVFVGGRIEWSQTGENIRLFACSRWIFNGTVIDRGALAGVSLISCQAITFSGTIHSRPGAKPTGLAQDECHFYMESCRKISLDGVVTTSGADDGGGGVTSPRFALVFATGAAANEDVTISGGDFTGYLEGATVGANSQVNLKIRGANGLDDREESGFPRILVGKTMKSRRVVNVAGGETGVFAVEHQPVGTFTRYPSMLTVTGRNTATGATVHAVFSVVMARESGGASVLVTPALASLPAGAITFGPGGTAYTCEITNVATDGSSFDLNITNLSAQSHGISVELV